MSKMLIVYPNNFLQGAHGTNTRVYRLVVAFKELGFSIDCFSYEGFSDFTDFVDFDDQNSEGLINNLYLHDFAREQANKNKPSGVRLFLSRVKRLITRRKSKATGQFLFDWASDGANKLFDELVEMNNYDVIAFFYTYQANLLKDKDIKAKKVYFMEDSMFLQQYSLRTPNSGDITLGKLMDEEIERIRYFDEIFCISYDEKIMYERLTGRPIHFLPHIQPDTVKPVTTPLETRKWDVLFIGFNNPYNVEGLNWFLKNVCPHLNKDVKIVLVGSATVQLDITHENTEVIPYAKDLSDIYENVKLSICPMFRGTGMKIKVVEAMSLGLPVVCNERGIDGLPDKTRCGCLVTQDAIEFAGYINRLIKDENFYMDTAESIKSYYSKVFKREIYVDLLRTKLCTS